MSWRDDARPIIAKVLADNPGAPLKTLRKLLRDAFPWGPREYHPYKIWLDEARDQLVAACLPPDFPDRDLESEDGRAVIADWWEDHGDSDRAKFLRSQRRLTKNDREFSATERQRVDRLYQEAMNRQGAAR